MALSREDKADVKGTLGKAMANKISKVTRDKPSMNASKSKALSKKVGSTPFFPKAHEEFKDVYGNRHPVTEHSHMKKADRPKSPQSRQDDRLKENYVNRVLRGH